MGDERERSQMVSHLFDLICEKGHFLPMAVPISSVKAIENAYKANFAHALTLDSLMNSFGALKNELLKSHAAALEIKKQYANGKGLQPATITECFICQTLADKLGLDRMQDYDDASSDHLPMYIVKSLTRYHPKDEDKSVPRYVYFKTNQMNGYFLAQCGGPSTIDAILNKDGIGIRIEFKEQNSKAEEPDITGLYDEDGKLTPNDDFRVKHPNYLPLIEAFNQNTDIFAIAGSNFSLSGYLNESLKARIINKVVGAKEIDLYVFQYKDKLVPILPSELLMRMSFSGSEIRPAGRNYTKAFTPKNLDALLKAKGAFIYMEPIKGKRRVIISKADIEYATARGGSAITRVKLNALYFVKIENVVDDGYYCSFDYEDILQLKPTISLHLSPIVDK